MKKIIQVWAFVPTGYDGAAMQPVEEFASLEDAEKAMKEPIEHKHNRFGCDYYRWRGHDILSTNPNFFAIEAYKL